MTAEDKTTREKYFAETFRGVGQLMHLLQDMSVPAHVRNDSHLLGDGYEKWCTTDKLDDVKNTPKYFSPSGITFLISDLFDTGQYVGTNPEITTTSNNIGLAEYTNANFFSDDTIIYANFTYPQINSNNRHYKQHKGPSGTDDDREYYLKSCSENYCETNPDKDYQGYLLAAVDYFDYWRQINALPENEYPVTPCLDINIFYDYSRFLISRAIGYSSQVLSYFFRGKMDMTEDMEISKKYKFFGALGEMTGDESDFEETKSLSHGDLVFNSSGDCLTPWFRYDRYFIPPWQHHTWSSWGMKGEPVAWTEMREWIGNRNWFGSSLDGKYGHYAIADVTMYHFVPLTFAALADPVNNPQVTYQGDNQSYYGVLQAYIDGAKIPLNEWNDYYFNNHLVYSWTPADHRTVFVQAQALYCPDGINGIDFVAAGPNSILSEHIKSATEATYTANGVPANEMRNCWVSVDIVK
ncbi:MAG: hypothetical protein JXA41_15255 [Deltaproteobacteria bacterium]|nr:hypothetical protein [Deltaproteobacteria bacterium]